MIKLDHYGVEGSGKTLKEAKADAGRKIAAMLKGDYVPEVITYRGHALLIWREPYGWYSKLLTDLETGLVTSGRMNGCSSHSSQEEAIQAGKMHLAQMVWTPTDGLNAPEILDAKQSRDFLSWARFQLKYQELKATGLPDVDCHRQACEAMYA